MSSISVVDVLNAVNKKLVEWFDYTIYIAEMPENFERPSFFLTVDGMTKKAVSFNNVEKTFTLRVVCYAEKNERFSSDTIAILTMSEEVMELFDSGKLAVGERQLNVEASIETNTEKDVIYVSIKVKGFDEHKESKENLPFVESVRTRFN